MKLNQTYMSNNNSYDTNDPVYIVVHNTDNYASAADAKRHAMAQSAGNIKGASAHVYVDDTEAYQATPFNRGCWHVGVNYGKNNLFGKCHNRNSIGVEICCNAGYDYEKAFMNAVEVVKDLMKKYNIPAERVVQHYDVCTKNCPSEIRKKNDWDRFKKLITGVNVEPVEVKQEIQVDHLYRVRKSWLESNTQKGAYKTLSNAKEKADEFPGWSVYDWNGAVIYTSKVEKDYLEKGDSGTEVKDMQQKLIFCGYSCGSSGSDGDFGKNTLTALELFQGDFNIPLTGIYDEKTKEKIESVYKVIEIYKKRKA